MSEELNRGVVMARRFELDEQIAILSGKHKDELAPLLEEKNMCEQYIKKTMVDAGEQQFKDTAGNMTFFVTKDSVKVTDMNEVIGYMLAAAPPLEGFDQPVWDRVLGHLRAHGLWGILNNAVNKTSVKEIIESTNTQPPGTEYSSFKDLSWRRGKA